MNNFNIADKVVLKGHDTVMVVSDVAGWIECVWFDVKLHIQKYSFSPDCLELV